MVNAGIVFPWDSTSICTVNAASLFKYTPDIRLRNPAVTAKRGVFQDSASIDPTVETRVSSAPSPRYFSRL